MLAAGIPFNVVLAPYANSQQGDPTLDEMLAFAESYIDPADPDRNYPIVLTDEDALSELIPWSGGHPKHCILSPEREIVWCEHGHGLEGDVRDTIVDLWESR